MFPCALGRVVGRADIRYNVALLSSGNRGRGTELTAASPPAPSAAPVDEIHGSCWMDRPPLCLIPVRRRVSRMSVPPTGAIHVRPLLHIPGGISIAPTVASACSRGGGTFISFYVTVRRFLFAGRRSQRFLQLPGRRPTSRHSGTRHKTHGGDCAIVTRTFPGLLETKSGRRKKSQKSIFLFSCSKPRWWSGKGDTDARRTLPTYCYVFHIME